MGRVLLCTGKYAKKPYCFENVCVNVYCVEEVCFLFASNPFMIDQSVMREELAQWLDNECGLTDLSHQLLNILGKGSQPGIFVNTIMSYVNYCSDVEVKKIDQVLQGNVGLNDFERQKKQADFLLKNRRYMLAIEEYDALCRRLPDTESSLKPVIYHNMGTAYAGIFMFGMAARYFKKAYDMMKNEESGIEFLTAQRLYLSEDAYIAFIGEHGEYYNLSMQVEKRLTAAREEFEASQENRMLTALKIYKDEGNAASYYEEIDKIIAKKKDEYREFVS
ncbi:MAG: tetratricopeptide repeat protein [Lachnospiraceae bacterium]|nr:hypothetical protein C819_01579 [Lachnospiraceae bacterium 10-1]MCX4350592.1 tetratricopeptide repeat protein [Lachnospiraceae bacterium]